MIIRLDKSQLFTTDPRDRFAREYGLPQSVFDEIWRRRKDLEYSLSELSEYIKIKHHMDITPMSLHRWIWKNSVFNRAQVAIMRGALAVQSDFFNEFEDQVVNELLKGLKSGVTKEPKSLA